MPQFRQLRGVHLPKHYRVYEWRVTDRFRLYLLLQLHRSEDSFTVEIAWTLNGRWPEDVPLPDSPRETSESGDMRFRIGLLWSPMADYWWDLAPQLSKVPLGDALRDYEGFLGRFSNPPDIDEAMSRVEPQVNDAIRRVREYAIPYFGRVAKAAQIHFLPDPV